MQRQPQCCLWILRTFGYPKKTTAVCMTVCVSSLSFFWFHTMTAEAPSGNEKCLLNKYRPITRHKTVNSGTKLKVLLQALWLARILISWMKCKCFLSMNTSTETGLLFTLVSEHRPCRHRRGYCGISIPGGGCWLRRATSVLGAEILLWTEGIWGLWGKHT